MEEVGLRAVGHDQGNMSKHVESSVDIARRTFRLGYLVVGTLAFYIGCDSAEGVGCEKGQKLNAGYLDTRTKIRHAVQDDVGHYTQRTLQAMLLKPVCNT